MLQISATELPRFMACNGSHLMAGSIPAIDGDTSARDEGTAAHYMATVAFNKQSTIEELVDRKAPNGVYMTEEMAQHVTAYLATFGTNNDFQAMECDTSHDNSPHWSVSGRTDFVATSGSILRVRDFKYGWRLVSPEFNYTLISHAIGFCKQHGFLPETIELSIFQPRPYHPDGALRVWPIKYEALNTYYNWINQSLSNPNDRLNTTLEHCGKCHALATCPAARASEMNAIDATETVFSDKISDADLTVNLDMLYRAQHMLKSRLEAFEELAKHRIKSGAVIDNFSVEMGLGNSRWLPGVSAEMLQMLTGQDLAVKKLPTPAEAKRRGVSEAIIKPLTERPQTGLKLIRGDANKKAERLFGKTK